MTVRIAVLDDYNKIAHRLADWSQIPGAEVTIFTDHISEPGPLIERLKDFDVVCPMRERTRFPRQVFENLPKLRLMVITGGRHLGAFDLAAAKERGVAIRLTQDSVRAPIAFPARPNMAEFTIAMMLALTRQIVVEDRNMRRGGWITTAGTDLAGSTLALLGLGNIARQVAKLALAFDMRVIAWSQNLTREDAAAHGVERVEKDALFQQADILSVQLALSDRTRGLVGARELALMKPTAYIVNTARGPIIDEAALIDTLKNRRIAGAALDVFDIEPLPPDHPLRSLDNTVLTPHVGHVVESKLTLFYEATIEHIVDWLAANQPRQ